MTPDLTVQQVNPLVHRASLTNTTNPMAITPGTRILVDDVHGASVFAEVTRVETRFFEFTQDFATYRGTFSW